MNDSGRDYSDLGIAVIGNGRWAQNHIKILKECGALLEAYDNESDYRDVINHAKSRIDSKEGIVHTKTILHGIVIATDPVMHFPITKYAMERGIAVYCEKPIANPVPTIFFCFLKIINDPIMYSKGSVLINMSANDNPASTT